MTSGNDSVTVSYGANSGDYPIVGKTVSEAKDSLAEALNLPENNVTALVSGDAMEASYVLQSGDQLEFVKPSGEKG